jgi:hypothetical protein
MEKKNSNQHQDSKKPADKKQQGSQQGSDKNQPLGKRHDSVGEPDRKKEMDDNPDETSKKVPHMNQKS